MGAENWEEERDRGVGVQGERRIDRIDKQTERQRDEGLDKRKGCVGEQGSYGWMDGQREGRKDEEMRVQGGGQMDG